MHSGRAKGLGSHIGSELDTRATAPHEDTLQCGSSCLLPVPDSRAARILVRGGVSICSSESTARGQLSLLLSLHPPLAH